ncbi:MAG: serine hydrolase domain-containing protein [Fibrobacterota bacterium]
MAFEDIKNPIEDILDRAIEKQMFPGAVVGVVNGRGDRHIVARGRQTYEPDARDMHKNTVFDVASITKVLPTSTCALKAIERGDLSLEDPIDRWIPEFASRYKELITVRHLLTHTVVHNFRLSSLKMQQPLQLLQSILSAELAAEPGSRFFYSNTTSIVLGLVLERYFGCSLQKLACKEVLEPLQLKQTGFEPYTFSDDRNIVPTEIDPWRGGMVCGEVHDESAWVLRRIMYPGSAGLFSTVPDLLTFLGDMLCGALHDGSCLLKKGTIDKISVNQIEDLGGCTGLGWELNQDRYMGRHHSARTIGKTGFTGCVIMADLIKGMGIAFLANFTWPRRKNDPTLINSIRSEIADTIFENS